MDPGVAISIAGIVYTLVITASDVLGDARQVYKKGASDANRDLDAVAKSIQKATKSLDDHLGRYKDKGYCDGGIERSLDEDDEELQALAFRASGIGHELSEALKKVQTEKGSKSKAIIAAVRSRWSATDIKAIEARLDGMRSEIQLRILIAIKRKVDNSQEESHRRLLGVLEAAVEDQKASRADRELILRRLTQNEALTSSRHDELVASNREILNEIKSLPLSRSPSPLLGPGQGWNEEKAKARAESGILSSLWYPSMHDRMESISDAYRETLKWLFKDPKEFDKPWDSFVDFLRADARTFWITGKPGSGKSTLMKYLQDDDQTKEHLGAWASGREIIDASFYFFYNGRDQQKSEVGLLVSLLHAILSKRRDLIQSTFEEEYDLLFYDHAAEISPPTVHTAKRALKRVLGRNQTLCFFLMVDGLDEFDPDVSLSGMEGLLELIESLTRFPNVKTVVSSRPLTMFEDKFASCPSLRVHELTRDDIRLYVFEKLELHRRMKFLFRTQHQESRHMVDSIVQTSSGVFLWVRLVVQSLLEGLSNSDTLQELTVRVAALPKDLFDLYRVLLLRVEPQYRSQTAELLRLALSVSQSHTELSVLGLWYALNCDNAIACQTPTSAISDEDLESRAEEMKSRLNSRCRGLLEIVPTDWKSEEWTFEHPWPGSDVYDAQNEHSNGRVSFLHRSVVEFLEKPDMKAEFLYRPELASFKPLSLLLYSSVLVLKTFRLDPRSHWKMLLKLACYAGQRALDAAAGRDGSDSDVVSEIDAAMSQHLSDAQNSRMALHEDGDYDDDMLLTKYPSGAHWSTSYALWCEELRSRKESEGPRQTPRGYDRFLIPADTRHASFLSFATQCGLQHFVKQRIEESGAAVLKKQGKPLLAYALWSELPWNSGTAFAGLVQEFLAHGCDPKENYRGKTVWHWYLRSLIPTSCRYVDDGFTVPNWMTCDFARPMRDLIPLGVDVNAAMWSVPDDISQRGTLCTVLLALKRGIQTCTDQKTSRHAEGFLYELRSIVQLLEERGATEKEWDARGTLIYPRATPELSTPPNEGANNTNADGDGHIGPAASGAHAGKSGRPTIIVNPTATHIDESTTKAASKPQQVTAPQSSEVPAVSKVAGGSKRSSIGHILDSLKGALSRR